MADKYDEANIYTLEDENGEHFQLEMLDTLEIDDQRYFALTPYHENPEDMLEDDGQLVVLKEDYDEDNEPCMITIDDDDEYERIGQIFLDRLNSYFEDEDELDGDLEEE